MARSPVDTTCLWHPILHPILRMAANQYPRPPPKRQNPHPPPKRRNPHPQYPLRDVQQAVGLGGSILGQQSKRNSLSSRNRRLHVGDTALKTTQAASQETLVMLIGKKPKLVPKRLRSMEDTPAVLPSSAASETITNSALTSVLYDECNLAFSDVPCPRASLRMGNFDTWPRTRHSVA